MHDLRKNLRSYILFRTLNKIGVYRFLEPLQHDFILDRYVITIYYVLKGVC